MSEGQPPGSGVAMRHDIFSIHPPTYLPTYRGLKPTATVLNRSAVKIGIDRRAVTHGSRGLQPTVEWRSQTFIDRNAVMQGSRGLQPTVERRSQKFIDRSAVTQGSRGLQPTVERRSQKFIDRSAVTQGSRGLQPTVWREG